jgi:hypothetical protein
MQTLKDFYRRVIAAIISHFVSEVEAEFAALRAEFAAEVQNIRAEAAIDRAYFEAELTSHLGALRHLDATKRSATNTHGDKPAILDVRTRFENKVART